MSEPTYRVDLEHHPANGAALRWIATVYRAHPNAQDDPPLNDFCGYTMEEAFEKAQEFCTRYSTLPEPSRQIFLDEAGDILDPHEVQR